MKRNNLSKKAMTFMLLGSLSVTALNGCSLLPPEDANRIVPTVAAVDKKEYTLEVVTRTDIVNKSAFVCNYSETESIDLSFSISGKNYGEAYVKKGSVVKAGDLLGTLDIGSLENDILKLEESIATHEKSLQQSMELMNLEIEKVNTQYKHGLIDANKKANELARIEKSYSNTNEKLNEALRLEYLEHETLTTRRDNCSIYAPIDGVITYITSEFGNGGRTKSEDGKTVISIIDASNCVFQAKTPLISHYADGDIVTMTLTRGGTGVYEAVISIPENLPETMYLYPTEEIADLEIGARATVELILDSRENVLALSNTAVRDAADFQYVYYINEDGIRDMKIIETGLSGGGMTEIVSGLNFGDTVIKK